MHTNRIIDGRAHAKLLLSNLTTEITKFKANYNIAPKLVVIIVGNNPRKSDLCT
jgi:5,10-methylene-tetrahydrofolate dehydrogenase/methenyl tetrahydrofolate cyclohydrolase